jgi:hypothetical protein
MPKLKMAPLVPVSKLYGLPLGKCGTNDRRRLSRESLTSARSDEQYPRYWVEGKTTV